jgi:predicted nucleic acid-binding protein
VNVYVETNFILELTFEQEQYSSCEQVLLLCETEKARIIIPAYSLAEPHEKLNRQARPRRELQQSLNAELRQLSRSGSYKNRISSLQNIGSLITQSNEEEQSRFSSYRQRLLSTGEVIALNPNVLLQAASYETNYTLSPQDAIVYASVLEHLRLNQPQQSCFLNRNSKDFGNPDIVDELAQLNCRMIPRFDHGYQFIRSVL